MKKFITLCLVVLCCQAFADKYQFYFFYKDRNPQTEKMEDVFKHSMDQASNRAEGFIFQKESSNAKPLLQKYGLKSAPMPFVLVVAPNGAIMGGFPTNFSEQDLLGSLTTPAVENIVKALQNHKLLLLCLQNNQTQQNDEAMKGVNEFKADPSYASATEVISLDPSDQENHPFLKQLNIQVESNTAMTVFIAPPAKIIGTFQGPTTKDQLISTLDKANAGCCPGGCCPGGCCPGGKCCP